MKQKTNQTPKPKKQTNPKKRNKTQNPKPKKQTKPKTKPKKSNPKIQTQTNKGKNKQKTHKQIKQGKTRVIGNLMPQNQTSSTVVCESLKHSTGIEFFFGQILSLNHQPAGQAKPYINK